MAIFRALAIVALAATAAGFGDIPPAGPSVDPCLSEFFNNMLQEIASSSVTVTHHEYNELMDSCNSFVQLYSQHALDPEAIDENISLSEARDLSDSFCKSHGCYHSLVSTGTLKALGKAYTRTVQDTSCINAFVEGTFDSADIPELASSDLDKIADDVIANMFSGLTGYMSYICSKNEDEYCGAMMASSVNQALEEKLEDEDLIDMSATEKCKFMYTLSKSSLGGFTPGCCLGGLIDISTTLSPTLGELLPVIIADTCTVDDGSTFDTQKGCQTKNYKEASHSKVGVVIGVVVAIVIVIALFGGIFCCVNARRRRHQVPLIAKSQPLYTALP